VFHYLLAAAVIFIPIYLPRSKCLYALIHNHMLHKKDYPLAPLARKFFIFDPSTFLLVNYTFCGHLFRFSSLAPSNKTILAPSQARRGLPPRYATVPLQMKISFVKCCTITYPNSCQEKLSR